jgi:hypothetical protein
MRTRRRSLSSSGTFEFPAFLAEAQAVGDDDIPAIGAKNAVWAIV